MRLLFVHEVNWRKKVVYEIHDFPELLSLRGHEVVFIDYPEGDEAAGFRRLLDLETRVATGQTRSHAGASVEVRTPGRGLPAPLDRPTASLTQVPAIWRALRDGEFDAVVLYGVPTNGWQTVRLARRCGVPVLFRAIDLSHALRPTPFAPFVRRAERSVYRRADWISTHNVALAQHCVHEGADPAAVSVDYPGLDLTRFQPAPRDPALAARYGIEPDHRVVLFMGTFYRFAGLDWFLDRFAPTMRERPDVRLVLVGGGEAEAALCAQIRRLGVESSVVFTGWAPYDVLTEHLCLADVAITPFEPGPVTHLALPGKVLQYLGCGLPTVSTPLDGLKGMLPEGDGIVYRQQGPQFAAAVADLIDDDIWRLELARAGRRAMERECQWDLCVDRFEAAIRNAMERSR